MKTLLPLLALWFCLALSASAQTQMEMNFQALEDFKKADAKLNKVYQETMKQLSPERQKLLRETQRAWLKYRDLAAKSAGAQYEGGSIQPLIIHTTMSDMTDYRTKQIKSLIEP